MISINIGRNPENEMIFQDPTVSRLTVKLILQAYTYCIHANCSTDKFIKRKIIKEIVHCDDSTIVNIKKENEKRQTKAVSQKLITKIHPYLSSMVQVKLGKICSSIGIILSSILLSYWISLFTIIAKSN